MAGNSIYVKVAELVVGIVPNDNSWSVPSNYKPFLCDLTDEEAFLMEIRLDCEPIDVDGLKPLAVFDELGFVQKLYERNCGGYMYQVFDASGNLAATMTSDERFLHNDVWVARENRDLADFGFNNVMMVAYAFSAAYRDVLLMHSSVVLKDEKGYMFLGKSGTGKSTHSSLWLKHIPDTALLNDDNPVVRLTNGEVVVFGSPWSGKTPCYKQQSAIVGALVLLEQKPYNKIGLESVVSALSALLGSCSIMMWDKPSYNRQINTMSQVLAKIPVFHLECLPDEAAARLSYDTIAKR